MYCNGWVIARNTISLHYPSTKRLGEIKKSEIRERAGRKSGTDEEEERKETERSYGRIERVGLGDTEVGEAELKDSVGAVGAV